MGNKCYGGLGEGEQSQWINKCRCGELYIERCLSEKARFSHVYIGDVNKDSGCAHVGVLGTYK